MTASKPQFGEADHEMQLLWERLPCSGDGEYDAYLPLLQHLAKPIGERSWETTETLLPPAPWQYVPLHALEDAGFIDCGTSIRVGWLTPTGERALAFLEAWGTDASAWNDRLDEAVDAGHVRNNV